MGLIRALMSDMVHNTVQGGRGQTVHAPGNGLLKRPVPQRGRRRGELSSRLLPPRRKVSPTQRREENITTSFFFFFKSLSGLPEAAALSGSLGCLSPCLKREREEERKKWGGGLLTNVGNACFPRCRVPCGALVCPGRCALGEEPARPPDPAAARGLRSENSPRPV